MSTLQTTPSPSMRNYMCPRCGRYYGIDWADTPSPWLIRCGSCGREFTVRA